MIKPTENDVSRLSDRLSTYTDKELVRIAQLQLPYVTTAYEVLFHRYHKVLVSVCYRYLGSSEEAQEAVNDIMLKVFHNLHRFEHRASFKTWIYKIAHNLSVTRLRKKQQEFENIDDHDFIAPDSTSEAQQDSKHTLTKWLDSLTLEDRTIVVFRVVGGLEFSEIAHIVEQKLSTVKMRFKRALDKAVLGNVL